MTLNNSRIQTFLEDIENGEKTTSHKKKEQNGKYMLTIWMLAIVIGVVLVNLMPIQLMATVMD
jgi:hypothetical protein